VADRQAGKRQIGRRQKDWQVTDSWQAAEQRGQASEHAGGQRDRQVETQKDRRTDRLTDRQADGQTDRQAYRQTDRQQTGLQRKPFINNIT
jgi:hypothetical protein